MSNTRKILYKKDLGVNFNGYPLEYEFCHIKDMFKTIQTSLQENNSTRFRKNCEYELVLEVRIKDTSKEDNEDKELNKVTEDNEVTSEVTRLQKKITNLQHSLSKKDEKIENQALELSSLLSQKQHLQQQLNLEVSVKEKYTKSLIIIEYLENKLSNKLSNKLK